MHRHIEVGTQRRNKQNAKEQHMNTNQENRFTMHKAVKQFGDDNSAAYTQSTPSVVNPKGTYAPSGASAPPGGTVA